VSRDAAAGFNARRGVGFKFSWFAVPPQRGNSGSGLHLNKHMEHHDGELVFRHACKLGLERIVSGLKTLMRPR